MVVVTAPLLNLIISQYGTTADHLQIKDFAAGRHPLGLKFILDSL
jgi:hypothetical protein